MNDLKEFEAGFNYDPDDLSSQGIGSGVHKKEDVEVTFTIQDRNGDLLFNRESIEKSRFCNAIVFDITDKNGVIKEKNFQSGVSNKLLITKSENESIFGDYEKDFGVIATVIDDSSIYNPSGYIAIYGNTLEINSVKAVDSRGTIDYKESLGVFLSGHLGPSGYLYSGKMYQEDKSDTPIRYFGSGEVIHEGSPYEWEAYLSWEYDSGDLSGYISYDNYKPEIEDFTNQGSWSLVVMDYSPNESFLISSGSSDINNPFGSYIDALGSGYIIDHIIEPVIVPSGLIDYPYSTGEIPEDKIDMQINLQNNSEYTEYSHINLYSYTGESLDVGAFKFVSRIDDIENKSFIRSYTEEIGLEYNQNTWLKFKPYSALGKGESFIVGPLFLEKEIETDVNIISSSNVSISSSGSAATINYKERNIDSVLYNESGVLDKIFVDQNTPYAQTAIYEPFSNETPEYYSIILDGDGKWRNTTFDYTFEFRKENDFYSVESRKITIVPTGTSQESGNFGYPLFKIKGDKDQDDYVDFDIKYVDSGIMLLCNTSGNPFDVYKYYKTSI